MSWDGRALLSVSSYRRFPYTIPSRYDGSVRWWDPQTGRPLGAPWQPRRPARFSQLSEDGRYLLFRSYAAYLTTNPLTGSNDNLYVRDLQIGTNHALTTATGITGVTAASMTPDGQFVAFAGQGFNFIPRLYVWEAQSQTRVYTNSAGASAVAVSISPNGARIAYLPSLLSPLYVADRLLKTNWFVSSGKFWSSAAAGLQFSADARYLVYATMATNSPSDTNTTQDVYLYDCLGGTNLLVSRSCYTTQAGDGDSDSPTISPDGRFIAFRSAADDLVPHDNNGVPDLFLFDRANQLGGGVYALDSRGELVNVTLHANVGLGGALFVQSGSGPWRITNSICSGHRSTALFFFSTPSNLDYNLFWANPAGDLDGIYRFFAEGRIGGCSAGYRFLLVTPEGYYRPCSHKPVKARSQAELIEQFSKTNTCGGCYVAIRSYCDKPYPRLFREQFLSRLGAVVSRRPA